MRILTCLFLVACTGAPAPTADPAPPEPTRPDVVIITLDTTRADRLGFYGDPLARTPNLDLFAKDGVVFREATTPVPLTLPAHTSLFSGTYPVRHGLRDNGGFTVGKGVPLLAERLQSEGYATGGFVASYVLDSAWGLDRGFDRYFDEFHPEEVRKAARFGAVERPAREVLREALAWWEDPAQQGRPRFLWVHLFDAHTPYEPPSDWRGDPYRGEIFEMDRALRPLLQSLSKDALVVVTADHGENLWDGRELEHGIVLTRSTTRVPLLIRPPGGVDGEERPEPRDLPPRPAAWAPVEGLSPEGLVLDVVPDAPVGGRVVETPVSLVDVMPTVLELVGAEAPKGLDGRSLAPALSGGSLPVVPVYSESVAPYTHYGWSAQHAARTDTRVALRDAGESVFDAQADPWWQSPLGESPSEAVTRFLDTQSQGWQNPGGTVDPTTARALEALGYATAQLAPVEGPLPSSRTRMDSLHRLLLAQGMMVSEPERAEAVMKDLVAKDPTLVDAWFSLGGLRWSQGDLEGALDATGKVLELAPYHPLATNNRVVLLREMDRADEALAFARGLVDAHPSDARWHRHVVDLLGRREAPLEVAVAAERGLEGVGEDPYLLYMLGLAHIQTDNPEGAIDAFSRSRKAGTQAHDVGLWLGVAYQKLGKIDEAVEAWKDQANLTPTDPRALVAAAMLLVDHDRCGEAMPLLMTLQQRGVRDGRIGPAIDTCTGQ